jgi:hypothetical protein
MVEVVHAQDLKNPEWTSVILQALSFSIPRHVSMQIDDAVLDERTRPYLVDIVVELINMWNESQNIEDRWYIINGNLWRSGPGDSIVSAVPEEVKNIPPVTGDEDPIGYDEEYIKRLVDSVEEGSEEGENV